MKRYYKIKPMNAVLQRDDYMHLLTEHIPGEIWENSVH